MKNNIITAPASDHRAIGFVERMIQTIKKGLGCMKLETNSNKFTLKDSMKSKVYQLRVCKKTTNVTSFQKRFGRKPNTPLTNISTTLILKNHTNEQILNHNSDADTVPVEDYLG